LIKEALFKSKAPGIIFPFLGSLVSLFFEMDD